MAVVRGLLAHGATRFALLCSLLAFGALGAVACDDDESATAETEVITSDFGQDPRPAGRCSGRPRRLRRLPEGPGAMVVRIEVFRGVVRCREARRVLKNFYPHPISTPPGRAWITGLRWCNAHSRRERSVESSAAASPARPRSGLPVLQVSSCPRWPRQAPEARSCTQFPHASPAVTPGSRRPATTPSSWSRWSRQSSVSRGAPRAEDPVPQRQSGRCHAGRSPLELRTSGGSDRVP